MNRALDLLGAGPFSGKHLFVKPNFNSADPPPGSTHNDTLATLVRWLQVQGASRLTVGDRSGMGSTREVMQNKGIFHLAEELGFDIVVFDELEAGDWAKFPKGDTHWRKGFALARPALEADGIIQTCCLKTHRFGGHFTLSLKNSVGLAAKQIPGERHNYMTELHTSLHQRLKIAELNAAYSPDLILLDGVDAFTSGGPDKGQLVESNVILAGTDRIAVDAVGVAILRHFGATRKVSKGPIFDQQQIARAVELGLGVSGPGEIELIADDPQSEAYAAQVKEVLDQG
jgi:uncharacterized protein (DUF362 family)